jgi:hypothetical protein
MNTIEYQVGPPLSSSDVRYAFRCLFGEDCDWEGLQLKPYHWINEL